MFLKEVLITRVDNKPLGIVRVSDGEAVKTLNNDTFHVRLSYDSHDKLVQIDCGKPHAINLVALEYLLDRFSTLSAEGQGALQCKSRNI